MCDKLTQGDIHIAAFGEVSSGKSSLLNALMGEARFEVSPLHGMTRRSEIVRWREGETGGVHLIDTPGSTNLMVSNARIWRLKSLVAAIWS